MFFYKSCPGLKPKETDSKDHTGTLSFHCYNREGAVHLGSKEGHAVKIEGTQEQISYIIETIDI